jgi:hypothetical protein
LLTNPDGGTVTITVTVPVITGLTPVAVAHGTSYTWVVTGSGFESGAGITLTESATAITTGAVTWVNAGKMTFTGTTTASITSSQVFLVTLTNPDGSSTTFSQTMSPS